MLSTKVKILEEKPNSSRSKVHLIPIVCNNIKMEAVLNTGDVSAAGSLAATPR